MTIFLLYHRDRKKVLMSLLFNWNSQILNMQQRTIQISSFKPQYLSNMNSNTIKTLYLRAGNKKTAIEKFYQPIQVNQIAKAIHIKFGIPISEQLLYSAGEKLQANQEVDLQQKSIVHFVDRRQTILQNINLTIRRPDEKQTHTFNIETNTLINDFISNKLYDIYFMESNNLFLVYLGRELNRQKSFLEQQVQNGAQIACLHVLFNLKHSKQVQNSKLEQKSQFSKKIQLKSQEEIPIISQMSRSQQHQNNPFKKKQQKSESIQIKEIQKEVQYTADIPIQQINLLNEQNNSIQTKYQSGLYQRNSINKSNFSLVEPIQQNLYDNLEYSQIKNSQRKNEQILIQQNQSIDNNSSHRSQEIQYLNEQKNARQNTLSEDQLDIDVRRSLSKAADQQDQRNQNQIGQSRLNKFSFSQEANDIVHASISDKNSGLLISPCHRNSIYQISGPEFNLYKSLNSCQMEQKTFKTSKSSENFIDSVHASISEYRDSLSPCQRNTIYELKFSFEKKEEQDMGQNQIQNKKANSIIEKSNEQNLRNIYDEVAFGVRDQYIDARNSDNNAENQQQQQQQQQRHPQMTEQQKIRQKIRTVREVQSIESSEQNFRLNTISQERTSQLGNSLEKNQNQNNIQDIHRQNTGQSSSLTLQKHISDDVWQKKQKTFKSEIRGTVKTNDKDDFIQRSRNIFKNQDIREQENSQDISQPHEISMKVSQKDVTATQTINITPEFLQHIEIQAEQNNQFSLGTNNRQKQQINETDQDQQEISTDLLPHYNKGKQQPSKTQQQGQNEQNIEIQLEPQNNKKHDIQPQNKEFSQTYNVQEEYEQVESNNNKQKTQFQKDWFNLNNMEGSTPIQPEKDLFQDFHIETNNEIFNPYTIVITTFEDIVAKKDKEVKQTVENVIEDITNMVEQRIQQQNIKAQQQQNLIEEHVQTNKNGKNTTQRQNYQFFFQVQKQYEKQSQNSPIFIQVIQSQKSFAPFQDYVDYALKESKKLQQQSSPLQAQNITDSSSPKHQMVVSDKKDSQGFQQNNKANRVQQEDFLAVEDKKNQQSKQNQQHLQSQQNGIERQQPREYSNEGEQQQEYNEEKNNDKSEGQIKIKLSQDIQKLFNIKRYIPTQDIENQQDNKQSQRVSQKSINLGNIDEADANEDLLPKKQSFGYIGTLPQGIQNGCLYQPIANYVNQQNFNHQNVDTKILSENPKFRFTANQILFPISYGMFNNLQKRQQQKKNDHILKLDKFLFDEQNLMEQDNKQNSKDLENYLYDRQVSQDYER